MCSRTTFNGDFFLPNYHSNCITLSPQLVGGAIFGIVLWLRLDFWTKEYLELNKELEKYLILIYITLAAGALIAGLSILGLIGACLKRKWLLIPVMWRMSFD